MQIGMTPIIYAVLNGNDEIFILLLDNGADIDIKDHVS